MRVFISSARKDADAVARIEGALRRRNIESSSWLDLPVGEEWTRFLDEASAKADGFIFFLGDGASTSQSLSAEWRVLLHNDWESKKPLIPVVTSKDALLQEVVPVFLRNYQVLVTSDFDKLAERVEHLLRHPNETRDPQREEEGRVDYAHRLEKLKEFALALKEDDGSLALRDTQER